MIFSKATWIAVTLVCQVSNKTKDSEQCYINYSGELFKTEKECINKKSYTSQKCVGFKSGEFLIYYKEKK